MNPMLNKIGMNANERKKLLTECAAMLEKYVNRLLTKEEYVLSSSKDMKLWKEVYYPRFAQTDILPDGKFFSGISSGNSGIGTDGRFTGHEFLQLIYRVYKSLYELGKVGQMG